MEDRTVKRLLTVAVCIGSLAAFPVLADGLTAEQVAVRNVAARGGPEAWRAVTSLTLSGQMDAGGKQETKLPYVLTMKRPHKSRLELRFQDQTAVQVFDGAQGWKWRPFLNRNEVEEFTAAEAKSAAATAQLDGPLVDYAKKGTTVELNGMEAVEGNQAYKLKLTMRDGGTKYIWVDAKTFLDVKIEGEPRRLDSKWHSVAIYSRDFRREGSVIVPHLLETAVDGFAGTHKMTIDKVVVNPRIDDAQFGKAMIQVASSR
jgi:outer membrane lipoprotein-sorting protein